MDLLRFGRVGCERAGDPVVKAHPAGNQQICFLNGVVDPRLTMHAHHAQVQLVGGGKAAQAKQGAGHGNLRPLGQRAYLAHRARLDDAVPGKNQRPLGGEDQLRSLGNAGFGNAEHGVATQLLRCRRGEIKLRRRLLRILGDVDQHRARAPRNSDAECIAQHRRHVLGASDHDSCAWSPAA